MPTLTAHETAAHVLALDASTEQLAVALHTPRGSLQVLAAGGAAASATLVPHINTLLAQAGVAYVQLDAVAFGRGPGAFTGLRTACAVAQGIGLAVGAPLLPLDSLLLVAEDARVHAGAADVVVLMDARMDEVYAARYHWQAGCWAVLHAPALFTLPALSRLWQGGAPALFAGSALGAFGGRLGLPGGAAQCGVEHDRAGALLRLALQAAAAQRGVDAANALPLYLRDKVALTTHERETAAAARAAAVTAS